MRIKSNKNNVPMALAMIILVAVACLAIASPARADGGFRNGQVVYATGSTAAVYDPCGKAGRRGYQFSVSTGEALTVVSHPSLSTCVRCGAYRVMDASAEVGWVYAGYLNPTPPKTTLEKVNATGSSIEDAFYSKANCVLATLDSDYFYWKGPRGEVWVLRHWDGKGDPRPYWK